MTGLGTFAEILEETNECLLPRKRILRFHEQSWISEHDFFGKPLHTFPDHALAAAVARRAAFVPYGEAFAEVVARHQGGELFAFDREAFRDRHVQAACHLT